MMKSKDMLFYLKKSKDIERFDLSLKKMLSLTNIVLCRDDLEQIIWSRDVYLSEHKIIDFSYNNLVKSVELAVQYENTYKKDMIELSIDIMEIFYYVRLANPITCSDEEIIEHLEHQLAVYDGDIDILRGYYENYAVLEGRKE